MNMKKLTFLVFVLALLALPSETLLAQVLNIGSLDGSRSRAPLPTASGNLGYGQLRGSLMNPANFGPGGIVRCPVTIAAATPTITAAYLSDKDVFFTSVFTGALTGAEAAAINAFVAGGGIVLVDANSLSTEQAAANSLLTAIGTVASIGPVLNCATGISTGGTISGNDNKVTNGPFGDIRGGTFGVSLTAILNQDPSDTTLMTCNDTGGVGRAVFLPSAISAGSGTVMYGGDPAAFDLFTSPAGSIFNPNNELMYLNTIACACRVIEVSIDIHPGSDPNSINCKSKGKIPVAILGSDTFDVADVDPESLTFGATGDEDSLSFCSPSLEDVNSDTFLDRVCHFNTQDTAFCDFDEVTEGILKGETLDGTPIMGMDSVRLVPPPN